MTKLRTQEPGRRNWDLAVVMAVCQVANAELQAPSVFVLRTSSELSALLCVMHNMPLYQEVGSDCCQVGLAHVVVNLGNGIQQ